jgi:ABC-type antimicrobial peptide transport system ATPase subunit
MIRYEMTNDDDGANSLLTFINDNNNTRIILTDSDVSELSRLLYKIIALSALPELSHD